MTTMNYDIHTEIVMLQSPRFWVNGALVVEHFSDRISDGSPAFARIVNPSSNECGTIDAKDDHLHAIGASDSLYTTWE